MVLFYIPAYPVLCTLGVHIRYSVLWACISDTLFSGRVYPILCTLGVHIRYSVLWSCISSILCTLGLHIRYSVFLMCKICPYILIDHYTRNAFFLVVQINAALNWTTLCRHLTFERAFLYCYFLINKSSHPGVRFFMLSKPR